MQMEPSNKTHPNKGAAHLRFKWAVSIKGIEFKAGILTGRHLAVCL